MYTATAKHTHTTEQRQRTRQKKQRTRTTTTHIIHNTHAAQQKTESDILTQFFENIQCPQYYYIYLCDYDY